MNQATELWDNYLTELRLEHETGPGMSLWDIYILDTTLEDWTAAMRFIADRQYPLRFYDSGGPVDFPADMGTILGEKPEEQYWGLIVDISGVPVNCLFFGEGEIEFHLEQAHVEDAAQLDALFTFMKGLAGATGKEVIFTFENNRADGVIFLCRPDVDIVEYVPAHPAP